MKTTTTTTTNEPRTEVLNHNKPGQHGKVRRERGTGFERYSSKTADIAAFLKHQRSQ